jgi:hypothetical protein
MSSGRLARSRPALPARPTLAKLWRQRIKHSLIVNSLELATRRQSISLIPARDVLALALNKRRDWPACVSGVSMRRDRAARWPSCAAPPRPPCDRALNARAKMVLLHFSLNKTSPPFLP